MDDDAGVNAWGCQYGDGVFCLAGISFELPISPEVSIHFRFG